MANLSEAEIELKKYQARMGLWKTGIIGGAVSILTAIGSATVSMYTTHKQEESKLQQQAIKSNAELRLQNMKIELEMDLEEYKLLGEFAGNALMGDSQKRLRFAVERMGSHLDL